MKSQCSVHAPVLTLIVVMRVEVRHWCRLISASRLLNFSGCGHVALPCKDTGAVWNMLLVFCYSYA